MFLVFSCFWLFHRGILNEGTFHENLFCFTHKTTYAYLSVFMDCWNIQEDLDSDLFWAGDGQFWGGFSPLCNLAPRIQTCHFFIAPKNCIGAHLLSQVEKLATLDPEKLQGFMEPLPLLDPNEYGVATISRLLEIIGLFSRTWSLL